MKWSIHTPLIALWTHMESESSQKLHTKLCTLDVVTFPPLRKNANELEIQMRNQIVQTKQKVLNPLTISTLATKQKYATGEYSTEHSGNDATATQNQR